MRVEAAAQDQGGGLLTPAPGLRAGKGVGGLGKSWPPSQFARGRPGWRGAGLTCHLGAGRPGHFPRRGWGCLPAGGSGRQLEGLEEPTRVLGSPPALGPPLDTPRPPSPLQEPPSALWGPGSRQRGAGERGPGSSGGDGLPGRTGLPGAGSPGGGGRRPGRRAGPRSRTRSRREGSGRR